MKFLLVCMLLIAQSVSALTLKELPAAVQKSVKENCTDKIVLVEKEQVILVMPSNQTIQ